MGDLKPIGSEKLPLDKKIQRIMEIANYGIEPKVDTHKTASLEYSITAADGFNYGIVRENAKYMVMKEGKDGYSYLDGMKNNSRYSFNSYSEALKKLNLLMKPINENYNGGRQLNLIGEQEEDTKFVLKQPKPDVPQDDMSMDLDLGTDTEESGDLDLDLGDDLGGDDMGMDMEMDVESDEDDEDATKAIQKLTGKLGQKLRELSEPEMTADIIKYVLNSIISAVDLEKLTMDDKDEIVEKFEDEDIDYTEEGEFDVEMSGEEELDLGDEDVDLDLDMGTEEELGEMWGAVGRAAAGMAMDKFFNEEEEIDEAFGGKLGTIGTLLDMAIKDPKLTAKIVKATLECLDFKQIGQLMDVIEWSNGRPEYCVTGMNIIQDKKCNLDFKEYLTSDNIEAATCLLKKLGPDMISSGMDKISGMFGLNERTNKWEDVTGDGKFTQADLLKYRGVDLDEESELNVDKDMPVDDGVMDALVDVFNESKVNKTLSKYFQLTPQEKKQKRLIEQKRRKQLKTVKDNFLNETVKEIKTKKLLESHFRTYEQEKMTKKFLKENKNFNFIGKNKRGGLVFKRNNNLVEISIAGRII